MIKRMNNFFSQKNNVDFAKLSSSNTNKVLIDRKYDESFIQGSFEWPLVCFYALMYRYGINADILHLTFSCAKFKYFVC